MDGQDQAQNTSDYEAMSKQGAEEEKRHQNWVEEIGDAQRLILLNAQGIRSLAQGMNRVGLFEAAKELKMYADHLTAAERAIHRAVGNALSQLLQQAEKSVQENISAALKATTEEGKNAKG